MSLPKATEQLSRALDKLENKLESTTMPIPRRKQEKDLTEVQAGRLLGGHIATLCQMTDPELVKKALRYWADADDSVWEVIINPNQTTKD